MINEFSILKENNIELKKLNMNIYIIHIKNRYFRGRSKCHPDDKYSSHLGGTIAHLRALKKYYKYCYLHSKDEKIKQICLKYLNMIPQLIEENIKKYEQSKKITNRFLKNKAKGLPTMRDKLQAQVNELIDLKHKLEKGQSNE